MSGAGEAINDLAATDVVAINMSWYFGGGGLCHTAASGAVDLADENAFDDGKLMVIGGGNNEDPDPDDPFVSVGTCQAVPRSLTSLALHAPASNDAEVKRLLATCPDGLETLTLRGTPVSDAIVDELKQMAALRYVGAVDTHITTDALRALAGALASSAGRRSEVRHHVLSRPDLRRQPERGLSGALRRCVVTRTAR